MADDDDDWDNDDNVQQQPSKGVNQRDANGMGYFNRAPLQSQAQPPASSAVKSNTMMNQSNNR